MNDANLMTMFVFQPAPEWMVWSFNGNYWAWFHILAGGWAMFLLVRLTPLKRWQCFLVLFALCIFWEIYEYASAGIAVYGGALRWQWDTFGDIAGAMLAAAPFLIGEKSHKG